MIQAFFSGHLIPLSQLQRTTPKLTHSDSESDGEEVEVGREDATAEAPSAEPITVAGAPSPAERVVESVPEALPCSNAGVNENLDHPQVCCRFHRLTVKVNTSHAGIGRY